MPHNIQQWNPNQANQENDAQYAADTQRLSGAANPSVFPSNTGNKMFYQLTTVLAALADSLSGKGYTINDANRAALAAQFNALMTAADMGPYALSNWVQQLFAPLASPHLTGVPTTPTPAGNDNSGQIANTAWVQAQGFATLAYVLANYAQTSWVSSTFEQQAHASATYAPYSWVQTFFQPKLGFTPIQQGGGIAQQDGHKIYIGWGDGALLYLTVDSLGIGTFAMREWVTSLFNHRIEGNWFILKVLGWEIAFGSGVINNGSTIPLPSGFIPSTLKAIVSPNDIRANSTSSSAELSVLQCSVDGNGVVNIYAQGVDGLRWPKNGSPSDQTANWMGACWRTV